MNVNRTLAALTTAAACWAGVTIIGTTPAHANPWQRVDCEQQPEHADCDVEAGTAPADRMAAGPDGRVVCRDGVGEVTECFIEGQGWIGGDGCRYLSFGSSDRPSDATGPGAWYQRTCRTPSGVAGEVVWLPDPQAPGPAELGRIAASRLVLPRPVVVVNPPVAAPQLVALPTWLWVEPGWWGVSRSASVTVPGVVVTATATPLRVVWSMGDGTSVTCDGPGTPYRTGGGDPAAGSPDCGHIFRQGSAGRPGGVFEVSARVTWRVVWSGGGSSGVAGPLFSATTVPVRVVEVRSVNTGGGR
jgi:hypothetical protein